MSSDLDIGDIEKEEFNSEYNSESKSSSDSSDDSGEKSKKNNLRDQIEEINQSKEEKDETPEKEQTTEKEKKEEKEGKEGKEGKERKEEKEEKDDNEEKDEHGRKREKKKSQQNKNKDNKIKEIKLNKKDDKSSKSSKTKSKESNDKKNGSDKGSGITDDNNRIIKKEISEHSLADNENKFFIPQYNQRLETLMNIISEKSSESDVNYKRRIKIENEIIRKEKRARKRYKKVDDIQFQIIGYPQTVNQIKKNEEYKLQKEKIKYLEAKNKGVKVTAETAPHYLIFTDNDLKEDGKWKMNPPIRSEQDRQALLEGIRDSTIDCLITDHAPHSEEEKSKGLDGSAFGIVGLETCFSAMYHNLVLRDKEITLEKLLELMCVNPRKIFNLPGPKYIEDNCEADFVIMALGRKYIVDTDKFLSMGRSTMFGGREVQGEVVATYLGGRKVYDRYEGILP